ncbi:MAG: fructosamine kinase family protein [Betaproteobacteria bacterium]|nr:fructosamine kinase family protein [Betaproteobacteria bacterium]
MAPSLRTAIEAAIGAASKAPFRIGNAARATGGCIHEAYRIEEKGGGRRYFVKCNGERFAEAFAAEMDGLEGLAAAGARVPRPLCRGSAAGQAFLVMEYLELGSRGDWAQMGRMLAAMHRDSAAEFGWRRDNFIGATPQPNRRHRSWIEFWRDERLAPQLALAKRQGLGSALQERGARLIEHLPRLLAGHEPQASLVHGDLWSGNAAFLADRAPVFFDPAVYHGDREADLAMSELFGGFPSPFYAAYREAWPLAAGYEARRDLYNLYHVLNHANLFGGGYGAQALAMMERLLAGRI